MIPNLKPPIRVFSIRLKDSKQS